MKTVRIRITCDPCAAWENTDNDEGVVEVPVAGGQTLDLCPRHHEGLSRVLALIAEWGASPATTGRKSPRKRNGAEVVLDPTPAASAVSSSTAGEGAVEVSTTPKKTRRAGKRERARRAASTTAARVDLACPVCGHVSPTGGAAGMHLRQSHNLTPGAVYGLSCPLCEHPALGSTGALGMHGRKVHGVTEGVAELFARAAAEGDPRGVVAARAAAVAEAVSPPT